MGEIKAEFFTGNKAVIFGALPIFKAFELSFMEFPSCKHQTWLKSNPTRLLKTCTDEKFDYKNVATDLISGG